LRVVVLFTHHYDDGNGHTFAATALPRKDCRRRVARTLDARGRHGAGTGGGSVPQQAGDVGAHWRGEARQKVDQPPACFRVVVPDSFLGRGTSHVLVLAVLADDPNQGWHDVRGREVQGRTDPHLPDLAALCQFYEDFVARCLVDVT
jgi:hypothetical protein